MDNSFSSPGAPPVIAPPPPKPRKSRGWMIFAIILIVLLGFSWLVIISQGVSRALNINSGFNRSFKNDMTRQVGPRLDECILEDNDAASKIAVITVDGIIASATDQAGNSMVDVIKAQL